MARRRNYTAAYKLDADGKSWLVSIQDVEACHTYGQSIRQARKRIREVLALCLDDDAAADAAVITDDIRLPAKLAKASTQARKSYPVRSSRWLSKLGFLPSRSCSPASARRNGSSRPGSKLTSCSFTSSPRVRLFFSIV